MTTTRTSPSRRRICAAVLVALAGADATADAQTTAGSSVDLGAAAWIPGDAAYYSATFGLAEAWDAILDSRALRRILALHSVQLALAALEDHPALAALRDARERDPLARDALAIATDALSHEVFFYAGAELVPLLAAANEIYLDLLWHRATAPLSAPTAADDELDPNVVAELVLAHADVLRMPPLIAGFRVRDPERCQRVLAEFCRRIGRIFATPPAELSIGGGRFRTLRVDGGAIPPAELRRTFADARAAGLRDDLARRLEDLLVQQTLALAVGTRGDYLLVAIGADTTHLAKLGQSSSLAAAAALAPVRQLGGPELFELVYEHEWLAHGDPLRPAAIGAAVGDLVQKTAGDTAAAARDGLDALAERATRDVEGLLADFAASLPLRRPRVTASRFGRGLETFTFSGRGTELGDSGRPLDLRKHVGTSPLAFAVSRPAPLLPSYRQLAHWLQIGYGWFHELAVPRMNDRDRREFERFERSFVPLARDLHRVTEELLLPSIDGRENAITADAEGRLRALPPNATRLPGALPLPRPALVLGLTDPASFTAAGREYGRALDRFLRALGSAGLPAPDARPFAGGTLYSWPFATTDADYGGFTPHALVRDGIAVLGFAPSQSRDIVEARSTLP
ncbi:MAG: hypothetical protein KDE27_30055, partial [Planctomycetes bacterium]|nr:hypothetical protein [Planctomycetota bacterium]